MIAKKYRLTEWEIRKVFLRKKPFFSYLFVANIRKNSLGHARLAIFLSAKHARGSVNRNFFRRLFYDHSHMILNQWYDIVIIPKKGTILSHHDTEIQKDFIENLTFLYWNIISHSYATRKNP